MDLGTRLENARTDLRHATRGQILVWRRMGHPTGPILDNLRKALRSGMRFDAVPDIEITPVEAEMIRSGWDG